MYIIKQIPEDFIVKEKSNLQFQLQGRYSYFLLQKKNRNTLDAIQEIAHALHLKEKDIGFAGSNDKNDITEQIISILAVKKEKVRSLQLPYLQLTFLGYKDQALTLGELEGNEFNITVRNLDSEKYVPPQYIVNYFDEQRFSEQNVQIGKLLLLKKFAEVVSLINLPSTSHHLQEHTHDFVGALKLIPSRLLRLYLNAYQAWLW